MHLSHPNGHFPIPSTTEWMMEEAAVNPFQLSRMGILGRQNISKKLQLQLEGAGNRSRAKATADPAAGPFALLGFHTTMTIPKLHLQAVLILYSLEKAQEEKEAPGGGYRVMFHS